MSVRQKVISRFEWHCVASLQSVSAEGMKLANRNEWDACFGAKLDEHHKAGAISDRFIIGILEEKGFNKPTTSSYREPMHPSNQATKKALGWTLHSRHFRRLMGQHHPC